MIVHINDGGIVHVVYCSTHLWHIKEIGKQRLTKEDRCKLAGN